MAILGVRSSSKFENAKLAYKSYYATYSGGPVAQRAAVWVDKLSKDRAQELYGRLCSLGFFWSYAQQAWINPVLVPSERVIENRISS